MENKKKQSSEEQVKPLFEDMGNDHIHDEKSYNDLMNR